MKGRIFLLAAILMFVALSEIAMGQPPHAPGNGHGDDTNQPGGPSGAPVGSGVMILITLSAAYGAKKIYTARKDKNEI
jgi:hypothetical protein